MFKNEKSVTVLYDTTVYSVRELWLIMEKEMENLPYGVGKVIFGEDSEQPYVKLGDGTVGIFSQVWDKENVGLKIAQLHESESVEPFSSHEYSEENPPHKTDGNEIHILFNNVKSIDAMIKQLTFIKDIIMEK